MKVSEIIERLNNKEKIDDLAADLTVSKDTLRRRLKSVGYVYNQSTKGYEFKGEQSEKNEKDEKDFSELTSTNSNKKVGKTSENIQSKVQKDVEEKTEFVLTEDEIKFVKDSFKRRMRAFTDRKFEVSFEKSSLPPRKPEKKTAYIISEKTFKEFNEFAESLENEYRVTQNELVEIALRKLMNEWQ